jgi:hypothetical protein
MEVEQGATTRTNISIQKAESSLSHEQVEYVNFDLLRMRAPEQEPNQKISD